MFIEFERTGGVTGFTQTRIIDTQTLPLSELQELVGLLDACQFFDLPEHLLSPTNYPDQYHYRITVQMFERWHSVEFSDPVESEILQKLVHKLTRITRRKPQ